MRLRTLFSFLLLFPQPTLAQSSVAELKVLDGWRTESGSIIAALEITLAPHWKTYWRAPGDSGIPPRLNLTRSTNLGSVEIHWPTPNVYDSAGARTIGYENEVLLPVEFTPKNPDKPISIAGKLEIGACLDVCVPVSFDIRKKLSTDAANTERIAAVLEDQPEAHNGMALAGLGCEINPLSDGMQIAANLKTVPLNNVMAAVFEHRDPGVWVSGAVIETSGSGLKITSDFVPPEAAPFSVARTDIKLTLIAKNGAVEINGCPAL